MAASGHLEWCQTIVGRLIRIQFSPGSFRRKFTALDLDLLMAVIAVCLAPAVHPHGPGRLGDEKQPLNGTRPVRAQARTGFHQFPGGDARYFNAGRNHPLLSF